MNAKKIEEQIPEQVPEPQHECFLIRATHCPLQNVPTLFWKVTIGVNALLMLVFAFTLWLMASTLTKVDKHVVMAKEVEIESLHKIIDTINTHKQLTMENRVVTSEMRGLMTAWIDEHRRRTEELMKKK